MPPRKVDSFDYYEFHVVIADDKSKYIAVGYDSDRLEVARISGDALEEVRIEIRQLLAVKSNEFVGYAGAINLFLRAFPAGFYDPFFLYDERSYKEKAHNKAKEFLSKDALAERIEQRDFMAVGDAARRTFTNLVFPNEAMAFSSFAKIPKNADLFARGLMELLHGKEFDAGFDHLSGLLAPAGAAKWTVLTYWPFILFPDTHMFLKPEVAQESARRLGEVFNYESRPSAAVYREFLAYVGRLRSEIAELKPRDNIDVQTFMYVVGNKDFMHKAVERRTNWMSRQSGRL